MAYADDMARIQRRRALAQALIQQGGQPQGQMAGRFFVAPNALSTIGALGSIAGGALLERKGEKEQKAATDTERKRLAGALRGLMGEPGQASGAPASPPADPRRAAALSVLQGLPVEDMQGIVGQQAVASLFPKPKELKNIDLGNEVGFADESGNVVRRVPKGAAPQGQTDDQREYEAATKQGFKGSLQDWILTAKKAGATNINLPGQKYPNSFNEALGKADVEQLQGYQKSAEGSSKLIGTLDQLEKLNPTAMSGGGAETRAQVANWLSGWTGVDVVDPKVLSDTQSYNAIVTKSILDALGGSLGAGVSNADTALIKATVPKLEYSPEARKQLMDYLRKRATEGVDVYNRAREYGEAHQGLKGFTAYPGSSGNAPDRKFTRNPDGSLTYNPE